MKKILLILVSIVFAIGANAERDVTKFLGIPVDGSKAEMISKLKAKGFSESPYKKDILEGEFNGGDVNVYVVTNGGKVCRIMVCDANPVDERSIQIRFNRLCEQFERNPKYMSLNKYTIPEDENIRYEINVNKKRYEAAYYQEPENPIDTLSVQQAILTNLLEKYTQEQIEEKPEEIRNEVVSEVFDYMIDLYSKKSVWFMISDTYGKYYITMFYDNEYNRANGEDL